MKVPHYSLGERGSKNLIWELSRRTFFSPSQKLRGRAPKGERKGSLGRANNACFLA